MRALHKMLLILLVVIGGFFALLQQLPVQSLPAQEFGLRSNRWTGSMSAALGGSEVWVVPGIHQLRSYPLPARSVEVWRGDGSDKEAPLVSADGLNIAVAVSIHYQPEPAAMAAALSTLPTDLHAELVDPLVREVLRQEAAKHRLVDLFESQQVSVQREAERVLRPQLKARGIRLSALEIGEFGLLHRGRAMSLQDRSYQPEQIREATGSKPLQSSEGLSLGLELAVRYALDGERLGATAARLPADLDAGLVDPILQGVIYKQLTRYTLREVFSTKRTELQQAIESELAPLLAQEGLLLRGVILGNVDLPADFRAGMDRLLAAELANQQMTHTLQLKQMQVRETELQAEAEKVRREKAAEAAAREQVIAAKAQEEAMRHVLPFKEKQVQQRKLEAEAERSARVTNAEGMAQARRIEAVAEAESRQKLADAEVYRMEQIGRVASVQLERDGALISRYPLMIQKTMADKLSDKVSVIIAAPPSDGSFIGNGLLGGPAASAERSVADRSKR